MKNNVSTEQMFFFLQKMRRLYLDKDYSHEAIRLFDSLSVNQFKVKLKIMDMLKPYMHPNMTKIVIWGGWYCSILLPMLKDEVYDITSYDIDEGANNIARNLAQELNIDHFSTVCKDVFDPSLDMDLNDTDIIINPSCEHMNPMNEWPTANNPKWQRRVKDGCILIFTSNDMYNIEGHINCVSSMEEFISQMPPNIDILKRDFVKDDRGSRFIIMGKNNKNKANGIGHGI